MFKPKVWVMVCAALVALAVGLPWLIDRDPPASVIELGGAAPADGRVHLAWRAAPGAARFLVEVLAPDQVPRFAGNAEGMSIDLPPDVSNEIMRGEPRLWRVTSFDTDGEQRATSPLSPLVLSSAAR